MGTCVGRHDHVCGRVAVLRVYDCVSLFGQVDEWLWGCVVCYGNGDTTLTAHAAVVHIYIYYMCACMCIFLRV